MAQQETVGSVMKKRDDKTTGLYKIAAQILKNVKTGGGYKSQLYQAKYPNKMLLNAVLMNVFKWEKVIDVLIEKSNILLKESKINRELAYVLITELMWSKFGLKGSAKNVAAVKKYKNVFLQLVQQHELEKLSTSLPPKVWKPRFFRVNTLVTTVEDVLKRLVHLKFNKLKTPKSYDKFLELIKSDKFKGNTFVQDLHIKELLVFNSKVKFFNLEDYKNGSLIIQDKASCLASYLLNPEPGSTVLDMCAAPGMKTSHLAAIMHNEGKLYAVDRCNERFNTLQNMLEKYNVKNAETFNMDALLFPHNDNIKYILVDPSCSGSGIVDRVRSDSTKQNENFQTRLKKLANVHAQLLNHALKSYPDLERLVYSTCSANPEENEVVVDEALSVNGNFKLLDASKMVNGWINKGAPGYDCSEKCINAIPNFDCTNGFFIAVFVRRDYEEKYDNFKEDSDVDESNIKIDDNTSFSQMDKKNDISKMGIIMDSVPTLKSKKLKRDKSLAKKNKSRIEKIIKAELNIDDITSQLKQDVDIDSMLSLKSKQSKREKSLAKKNKSKIEESLEAEVNIDDSISQLKQDVDMDSLLSLKSKQFKRDKSLAKKSKSRIEKKGKVELNIDDSTTELKQDIDIDSMLSVKSKQLKRERSLAKKNKSKIEESLNVELNNDDNASQLNTDVDMDSMPSVKTEKLKRKLKKKNKETEKKTNAKFPTKPDVKSKNAKRRARRLKLEQCIEELKKTKINN